MDKPARKPNSWVQALKKFNEGRETYLMPRRGTEDFRKVKEIQREIVNAAKEQPQGVKVTEPEEVKQEPATTPEEVKQEPTPPDKPVTKKRRRRTKAK